jgi:hypothetical protein
MDRLSTYKKGNSIHIKPENKGKFNATKKATGKTTEELTHSKNPVTKKRAIFAQNATKWDHTKKHKKGGVMAKKCNCGGMLYKKTSKHSNGNLITKHGNGNIIPGVEPMKIDTATKVATVPQNYNFLQKQGDKQYYAQNIVAPKAIAGGTGANSEAHNNWLIGQLKSGVSPENLAKQGHMSSTNIDKYKQYYTPKIVYTQPATTITQKPLPVTPVQQKRRIDFSWNSGDVAKYIYPNDMGEYGNNTKEVYIDRKTGQEIDLNTSYDQSGKYVPKFNSTALSPAINKGTYTKGAAPAMKKGGILNKY